MCEMAALEILGRTYNRRAYRETKDELEGLPRLRMGAAEWQRAFDVHQLLETQSGTNVRRSVKVQDILIAACAEVQGVVLVHYDKDFDVIGAVTQQPMRWAAPRGTLR